MRLGTNFYNVIRRARWRLVSLLAKRFYTCEDRIGRVADPSFPGSALHPVHLEHQHGRHRQQCSGRYGCYHLHQIRHPAPPRVYCVHVTPVGGVHSALTKDHGHAYIYIVTGMLLTDLMAGRCFRVGLRGACGPV